jgi:hypothetical protein
MVNNSTNINLMNNNLSRQIIELKKNDHNICRDHSGLRIRGIDVLLLEMPH